MVTHNIIVTIGLLSIIAAGEVVSATRSSNLGSMAISVQGRSMAEGLLFTDMTHLPRISGLSTTPGPPHTDMEVGIMVSVLTAVFTHHMLDLADKGFTAATFTTHMEVSTTHIVPFTAAGMHIVHQGVTDLMVR